MATEFKPRVVCLYGNGPEPLAVRVACALRDSGEFDSTLVYWIRENSNVLLELSKDLGDMPVEGVRWPVGRSMVMKVANRFVALFLLARVVLRSRPDVIHAWNFDMFLCAVVASILSLRRIRVMAMLQDTSEWMLKWWAKPVQKVMYALVDEIFVTSQGFTDCMLRKFGLVDPGRLVRYLPNVPSENRFSCFEPKIWSGSLTVGYIGMIRGKEGVDTLVEAVDIARQRGCCVRALFAGRGILSPHAEELSRRTEAVDFAGVYDHSEIEKIYAQVDVIYGMYDRSYDKKIHLAYRFCEAMNCGIPIVCAEGSYMGKLVAEDRTGFAVPLGDATALADLFCSLFNKPELLQRASLAMSAHREEYRFESYQEMVIDAVKKTAAKAKRVSVNQEKPA
jgi:glycosyltransferase involved in cell wall biosynthesis